VSRVWVSEHAALRFRERVRPSATLRQAVVELSRLCAVAREVEKPVWVREYPEVRTTWLELSDGIVVACRAIPGKGRRLHAVTVLGRSGMSDAARAARNRARSRRTAAVRARKRDRPTERPDFRPSVDD